MYSSFFQTTVSLLLVHFEDCFESYKTISTLSRERTYIDSGIVNDLKLVRKSQKLNCSLKSLVVLLEKGWFQYGQLGWFHYGKFLTLIVSLSLALQLIIILPFFTHMQQVFSCMYGCFYWSLWHARLQSLLCSLSGSLFGLQHTVFSLVYYR